MYSPTPQPPPKQPLHQRSVGEETVALAAICLLDLLSTMYWLSRGEAQEGNPLMARFVHMGPVAFIVAKLCAFVPALLLAEWYRPRNPTLIRQTLRLVALLYVGAYLLGAAPHLRRLLDGWLAG